MKLLIFLAQAAAASSAPSPDLVELARIVEPYARCEFAREPAFKALQSEWSIATRKSYADRNDKAAADESARLMDQLRLAKLETQAKCGHEGMHEQLRARLRALHPEMDDVKAHWLARSTFQELNNLNETVVKFGAGIFPAPPVAPPPPPGAR